MSAISFTVYVLFSVVGNEATFSSKLSIKRLLFLFSLILYVFLTIYKGANNWGASVDAPQSVQIELFIKEYLFPSEYNRPLVLPFCKPKHIRTWFLVGITLIQMYCDGTITPENSAFFPNCEIKGNVLACTFSTPKRQAGGSNPLGNAKNSAGKPSKIKGFRRSFIFTEKEKS